MKIKIYVYYFNKKHISLFSNYDLRALKNIIKIANESKGCKVINFNRKILPL